MQPLRTTLALVLLLCAAWTPDQAVAVSGQFSSGWFETSRSGSGYTLTNRTHFVVKSANDQQLRIVKVVGTAEVPASATRTFTKMALSTQQIGSFSGDWRAERRGPVNKTPTASRSGAWRVYSGTYSPSNNWLTWSTATPPTIASNIVFTGTGLSVPLSASFQDPAVPGRLRVTSWGMSEPARKVTGYAHLDLERTWGPFGDEFRGYHYQAQWYCRDYDSSSAERYAIVPEARLKLWVVGTNVDNPRTSYDGETPLRNVVVPTTMSVLSDGTRLYTADHWFRTPKVSKGSVTGDDMGMRLYAYGELRNSNNTRFSGTSASPGGYVVPKVAVQDDFYSNR